MNKMTITDLQDYLEENGQYARLLKERMIDEDEYQHKVTAIIDGLECLKISGETCKIFHNRKNLIIYLGSQLTKYEGHELTLYVGLKKMGLPIPDQLMSKCPNELIALIDQAKSVKYINDYSQELQSLSLSPDIFLAIHKSILACRVETLLPTFMNDIDRITYKTIDDLIKKIPVVFLYYLPPQPKSRLLKKIASFLQPEKERMTNELKNIDLFVARIKEQMNEFYQETNTGLQEIIHNEVEQGANIDAITQKTANFFGRLERLFLGNIYHLNEYDKRRQEINKFFGAEEDLKYLQDKNTLDRRKKISELYQEYIFLNKYGALTQAEDRIFFKNLSQAFEDLHHQKSKDLPLLNKFEKKSLLGIELDFYAVKEAYHAFAQKTFIPHYLVQCLFDIVQCMPPKGNEPVKVVQDLANLKILGLSGTNILEAKDSRNAYSQEITTFIESFRKSITVLVYDIRGSSYMGLKLQNALKEQKIKYKFAKEMAEIAKKYNAFLLKDTGDGGIVWFADNAGSLYDHVYAESITGRGMKLRHSIFSGGEFELIPATDSAKRAVLCARDMVVKAEEFIKANFMHYREWFAEVTERTMEVEGVTYALLPPEFKSLFRIGVGLASGTPGKDVVIAANSFGDPDLIGPILADAHLYSMERQPGRSVIICDLPTFINLILNIEHFEYPVNENNFEKYVRLVEDVKKSHHAYNLSDFKTSITPRGTHILEEVNKSKALTDDKIPLFLIGSNNILYNEQQKKVKPLFEIRSI